MAIAVKQWHIPLHAHAEPFVFVSADGKIRTEEYRQIDVRLFGDAA